VVGSRDRIGLRDGIARGVSAMPPISALTVRAAPACRSVPPSTLRSERHQSRAKQDGHKRG
jgi:hypothetical protein